MIVPRATADDPVIENNYDAVMPPLANLPVLLTAHRNELRQIEHQIASVITLVAGLGEGSDQFTVDSYARLFGQLTRRQDVLQDRINSMVAAGLNYWPARWETTVSPGGWPGFVADYLPELIATPVQVQHG